MSNENKEFSVSADLLTRMAETMTRADLTEIEFVDGERSLRLSRTPAPVAPAAQPVYAPMPAPIAAAAAPAPVAASAAPVEAVAAAPAPAPAAATNAIKSPMVGTAYMSPEPGKPAFIKVGDKVSKGQTLMIIEAMKVMNPLPSPAEGVVREILVADAEPVEFDQPLVVIE